MRPPGKKNQSGSILAFIGAIGVAIGILALFISKSMNVNSHQMVYFDNLNKVYSLAESGMAVGLGRLSVDPTTGTMTGLPLLIPASKGGYSNYVQRSTVPIYNSFYIQTTATITAQGKQYVSRLHTYAGVANLGEYFAALKNTFVLSPNMNAGEGGIYAPNVEFRTDGDLTHVSRAKSVEYVYGAIAFDEFDVPYTASPSQWDTIPSGNRPFLRNDFQLQWRICLGENQAPGPNQCKDNDPLNPQVVRPKQRDFPLQFPALRSGDFNRYQLLAGAHQTTGWMDFTSWDFIFPPGYEGAVNGLDSYNNGQRPAAGLPGHNGASGSNVEHVFYAESGIKVGRSGLTSGTTVFGQVLLVTPGDIEIWGDIFSVDNTGPLPGEGVFQSSSTAHQLVLIAGGQIIIKTVDPVVNLGPNKTRAVDAFFFAPNGQLYVEGDNINVPNGRNFNFRGSWVLGMTALAPNNIPNQFRGNRQSSYMTSLKTHTPPYLPALSQVYQMLEEPVERPNLY